MNVSVHTNQYIPHFITYRSRYSMLMDSYSWTNHKNHIKLVTMAFLCKWMSENIPISISIFYISSHSKVFNANEGLYLDQSRLTLISHNGLSMQINVSVYTNHNIFHFITYRRMQCKWRLAFRPNKRLTLSQSLWPLYANEGVSVPITTLSIALHTDVSIQWKCRFVFGPITSLTLNQSLCPSYANEGLRMHQW